MVRGQGELIRSPGALLIRAARFEDVAPALRMMESAIEWGCRGHYTAEQRWAVFASYAQSMFVDVLGGFVTLVAEEQRPTGPRLAGFAQLDPEGGRLRALFVASESQRQGYGRRLLGAIVQEASARRMRGLTGAMSLNAVPFYTAAGFRPTVGRRWLVHVGVAVPVIPMELALSPIY